MVLLCHCSKTSNRSRTSAEAWWRRRSAAAREPGIRSNTKWALVARECREVIRSWSLGWWSGKIKKKQ